MDQRLFLAISLSMVVLIGYYLVFPPPAPKPVQAPPPQAENGARSEPGAAPAASLASPATGEQRVAAAAPPPGGASQSLAAAGRKVRVETPLYAATIDTTGGTLSEFRLERYRVAKENIDWADLIPFLRTWLKKEPIDPLSHENMAPAPLIGSRPLALRFVGEDSLTRQFDAAVFESDAYTVRIDAGASSNRTVELTGRLPDGMTVVKRLTFQPDSYLVDYSLSIVNYGSEARAVRIASMFGEGPRGAQHPASFRSHTGPIWQADGDLETEDSDDITPSLNVPEPTWIGITDTYFITAAQATTPISHGFYETQAVPQPGADPIWIAAYGMELPQLTLGPGKMVSNNFKLYLGPKRVSEMEKFGSKLETSLDLTLAILAQPMLALMRWFYSFTGNYGVSIILLTIVVRVLLFPLTYRGMLSMKRMQKLQPRMVALREKYKKDKERLNKEMIAMYRKHKMNPIGGCLPIALQIPIFFALYSALLGAIELRHEPFIFWITDLSSLDGLYITPVLMGGSMFIQQRMTPTSLDPTQAKIMMWMPLVFMFFMLSFPAGLTVYWLTSNILSIAQQAVINRIKVPEPQD